MLDLLLAMMHFNRNIAKGETRSMLPDQD